MIYFKNLFYDLCNIPAVSGREEKVRQYILREINNFCEVKIDNAGNIIAFKKGRKNANKKIMYTAHMDEVGFIINYIKSDGMLKFLPVGGIDPRVVLGRKVKLFPSEIYGVIGQKAVHIQTAEEKTKVPDFRDLFIDIGAVSKHQAEEFISQGDMAVFDSDWIEFGNDLIKAKAIDDRFGCAVLCDMIKSELEYDTYFAFNVQEEIGCHGALSSVVSIKPDIAVVIEATTAADFGNVPEKNKVCKLGSGAVLSFMDNGAIYDKSLFNLAVKTAENNNIPYQIKQAVAGGNDSSAIQTSLAGIKVMALSVPCRYLHSPSCTVNYNDCKAVINLSKALIEQLI